jgi:hypothetical protein
MKLVLATVAAVLLISPVAVGEAGAVVYCKTIGFPKGCVARPVVVAPGVGAVGVGVRPGLGAGAPGVGLTRAGGVNAVGVGVNAGGPVNRIGVR